VPRRQERLHSRSCDNGVGEPAVLRRPSPRKDQIEIDSSAAPRRMSSAIEKRVVGCSVPYAMRNCCGSADADVNPPSRPPTEGLPGFSHTLLAPSLRSSSRLVFRRHAVGRGT
jgi:hypothetical protein